MYRFGELMPYPIPEQFRIELSNTIGDTVVPIYADQASVAATQSVTTR